MNLFTKLGCLLIGWNPDILKECGEASHRTLKKYTAAILILMILWGAIGFCFAERYIRIDSMLGKLSIALVFVVIIICIERFVILTVGKLGLMGFFRFMLAILMAFLGSTVFDQIIFKNDVDVKMKEVRTEQINNEIPKRMAFLDAEIRKVTLLMDSIGKENIEVYATLSKNPVIVATDVSTTTKQTGVDANGDPIIEKITNVVRRDVENPLSGRAKANEAALKVYQDQLSAYQAKKISLADDVRKEYESAYVGFLEELQALFSILKDNNVALLFYTLLFLFLTFLELLVVTSKGGDRKCDYDLAVEYQLRIKGENLRRAEHKLLGTGEV